MLEHRQALTGVRLDRPGDHVAARVGHQATHAGDLADLHHVPSGTGADHHVDGVELLGREERLHGLAHLLGGLGPDLHFLLAPLAVGDDAPAEVLLLLLGLLLVVGQDCLLLRRRLHVVDGDGQARLGRVVEAEVLDGVEAVADVGLPRSRWRGRRRSCRMSPLRMTRLTVLEARRAGVSSNREPAVGGGPPAVSAPGVVVAVEDLDAGVCRVIWPALVGHSRRRRRCGRPGPRPWRPPPPR